MIRPAWHFAACLAFLGLSTSAIVAPGNPRVAARSPTSSARCAMNEEGPYLSAFVSANPGLRSAPIYEQLEALRGRSRLEWARAAALLLPLGALPEFMVQFSDTAEDEGGTENPADQLQESMNELLADEAEEYGAYNLGANSPLPAMRQFVEAYAAQMAGDSALALATAEAAIDQVSTAWRPDNAGLVLGYTVVAEGQRAAGQTDKAIVAADLGLRAIAAHPERATELAAFRVNFLLLKSEILTDRGRSQRGLERPGAESPAVLTRRGQELRAEAAREQRRRTLALTSPLFNLAAVIPGLQPVAEWSHESGGSVLSFASARSATLSNISSLFSSGAILAALIPSTSRAPVRVRDGLTPPQMISLAAACIATAGEAAQIGDFATASAANAQLLGLLSEANARRSIRAAFGGNEAEAQGMSEAMEEFGEAANPDDEGMAPLFFMVSFLGDGRIQDLAARLEATITPGVGLEALQILARDEERSIPMRQIRAYREDLSKALIYVRTAVVMLLRPPSARDVRTMREASAWASGPGGARIRSFLTAIEFEIDYRSSEEFFETAPGRLVLAAAPAVFDSFGWAAAQSLDDRAAKRTFEQSIYRAYERYLRAQAPARMAMLTPALRSLSGGSGRFSDRAMHALPPVIAAAASTLEGGSANSAASNGNSGGETGPTHDTIARSALATFLVPLAAREERWSDIVSVGLEPARALLLSDDNVDLDELVGDQLFATAAPSLAYLIQALVRDNRGQDAVALLDRLTPPIREADQSENGNMLAFALPDELLASAVAAYASRGRYADALLFARIRMRRSRLFANLPRAFGGLGLRGLGLDERREIFRNPAEQMIALAVAGPPSEVPWDDVLAAIDSTRQNEAGDTILIRALANRSPESRAAYDLWRKAIADRRRCLNRPGACRPTEALRAEGAARERLMRTLPRRSAALLSQEIGVDALRNALRPGELVLSTTIAEGRVVIFTLSREAGSRLALAPLPYGELEGHVDELERQFQLPDVYTTGDLIRPTDDRLRLLYANLVGPVADQVGAATHILWSPDRRLAALPIAALRAPSPIAVAGEPETFYLGLAKALSFSPRLSAFMLQRGEPAAPPPAVSLAIGDVPFTGRADGRGAMGASRPSAEELLNQRPTAGAGPSIRDFVTLTQGEARTRESATLDSLREFGERPVNLLMFYTHGLGSGHPLGAGLIMARGRDGDLPLLTPEEVMSLGLQPRYVLLAACSTGASAGRAVEPYGGLVKSFLALGARAVLTAQSPVDESATAQLTRHMLQAMVGERRMPSEALRIAQRRLESQREFANPMLWAQLVWVGDGARF